MKSCKIVIRDEVNCKIENLDTAERRDLHKMFTYEIPGARFMPAVKLGRWDGKASYFSMGGSTYINLLYRVLEVLDQRGYKIDLDDRRPASYVFDFDKVTESTYSHINWPSGHELANMPIMLRDYQVAIVNKLLETPQCVAEVATGAGKTMITAALSHCVQRHGRSVVIVPNKSLVVQTERDYRNLGLDVGVYFGDRKEIGHTHTISTWQSLNNIYKTTKSGTATDITAEEFIQDLVCVIVDEAHSAKAEALKTLMTQMFHMVPLRWGLTGTVPKDDFASVALLATIGPVVHRLGASELQDRGVLANCHVNIMQLQDHADFQNYQKELKYLLENSARLDAIAGLVAKIKDSGNTLILVDRVAAGHALVDRIADATFISGETKMLDRKAEYDQIATSTSKVIVATYGIAAVGLNIPRIFNLILIEPGKSFVRVIQSIGRGIRKAEDKDSVEIWDITSSCKFSKRHLTTRKAFYRDANYPFSMEKLEYR